MNGAYIDYCGKNLKVRKNPWDVIGLFSSVKENVVMALGFTWYAVIGLGNG